MTSSRILLSFMLLATGGAQGQWLPSPTIAEINAAGKARARLQSDGTWITLDGPGADSASLTFRRGQFLNRGGTFVETKPPLLVSQLDQIQVANGTHAWKGAKIGGSIGIGLVLLAAIACQGDICALDDSRDAVIAFAFWTGVGAGIGALIGSGSPQWRTVYPTHGP